MGDMGDKDNLSAFPVYGECRRGEGLSLRQYAAIKLRVPESGVKWLDAMIRESRKQDHVGLLIARIAETRTFDNAFLAVKEKK